MLIRLNENPLPRKLIRSVASSRDIVPRAECDFRLAPGAGGVVKVLVFDRPEHIRKFRVMLAGKHADPGSCDGLTVPLWLQVIHIPKPGTKIREQEYAIVDPRYHAILHLHVKGLTPRVIAHEAVHVAIALYRRQQHQFLEHFSLRDMEHEEIIAYAVGDLSRMLHDFARTFPCV